MPVNFDFDFKKPDYGKVFRKRLQIMQELDDPLVIAALKTYYKKHPAQFINDWGCTFDPRNADIGLPSTIPFILFEKQEEWVEWLMDKWQSRKPGLTEKSRDMGLSWLSLATACTICLFNEGVVIGFGSRKEEYVDKIGSPKSLFWKARKFLEFLPKQFTGGWQLNRDAPHMRIKFPGSNSTITGESGDGIGRGDRTSIYFVDEAAYIERPELIEASLSNTTNCRIDISSARGMANPFAQKRFSGKIDVFTFHWRDDPRKDETWYSSMENNLDPVTLAQEVDINYAASVDGVVLPVEWVLASVNAAQKLGIEVSGARIAALDIADEGKDLNAIAFRYGIELRGLRSWSGKGSDTLYTCEKAFMFIDEHECNELQYDADGIGALVRADARMINERRSKNKEKYINVIPFRGSGEVVAPDREMVKGRKNKDYFMNRKAQSWWSLRIKFQNTYRAIQSLKTGEPTEYDKEELISIPSNIPEYTNLIRELSQPTYTLTTSGKILVDKSPDGTRSPNLADAVMMLYSPAKRATGLFTKKVA
jgi:hypothetical protein